MTENNTSNTRLRLASWNVGNMKDLTKLLYILDTLSHYEIDIALLQETRIRDGCEDLYKNYTLHFPTNEKTPVKNGVAVAYKNSLKPYFKVLPVEKAFCDRIMHCVLQLGTSTVHFINVYAPTEESPKEDKKTFYLDLKNIFSQCKINDKVFIFGDFNAHIGPSVVKLNNLNNYYFYEKSNTNGETLIEFCKQNDLSIFNTISNEEGNNKITHCNARKTYHELDLLIIRNNDLNSVTQFKSFTELVYTDHFIVVVELDITLSTPIPTQIKIDLAKFIFFLMKENPIFTEADLNKNWELFKHCIERLDISVLSLVKIINQYHTQLRAVIVELKEAVANYPLTHQTFLWTEELKLKRDNAVALIKECLKDLSNSDFQCVKPKDKEIVNALTNIILKQPVWENRSIVLFSWSSIERIPSWIELERFFSVLEIEKKSPKYKHLKKVIHSMVTAIWKNGLVPLEICFASIFTTEKGQRLIDVLNITYNAVQSTFLERWKGISSEPIPGILHFSDSADMAQSLQIMQHKCNETKRHLYMAFLKWPEISEININKLIDLFLKLPFFNAFSPFADNQEKASIDIIFSYVFYVVFRYLKHLTIKWPAKHEITTAIFGQKCKSKKQQVINVVYFEDDLVILASSPEQLNKCLTGLNEKLKVFGFCISSLEGIINIKVEILVPEVNSSTKKICSSLVPENRVHDWINLGDGLIASPRLLERYSKKETTDEEDAVLKQFFTYKENQTTQHRALRRKLITINNYIICTGLVQNKDFERIFKIKQILLLLEATKKYWLDGEKSCFANIFFSELALDYLPGEPETSFLEVCKVGLTNFKISMKTLKERCKNVDEINRFIEDVQRL